MTIDHARREQLAAAAHIAEHGWDDRGAGLGLADWFAEEMLIEKEREGMNINWRRTTKNVWTLGAVQCVEETPGQWRVYRDGRALLESFPTVTEAMAAAERERDLLIDDR